jgi:nucleotide-binding universal stress UspA family protein
MQRFVVGIDGSPGARKALRWALDEARMHGAALDVVHAWHVPYLMTTTYLTPTPYEPREFEAAAGRLLAEAVEAEDTSDVEVRQVLVAAPAAPALLDAASGADLLVVGSHGRGGFTGLMLGSVSQHVAQRARCPVVVVPADDR